MLRFHHTVVNRMSFSDEENTSTGIESFENYYNLLKKELLDYIERQKLADNRFDFDDYLWTRYNFFRKKDKIFSHYFANLFAMLTYLDKEETDQKDYYASLIRAQLSEYEIYIILYYLLRRKQDFQQLVVRYRLLRDVENDKLVMREDRKLFPQGAFWYSPEE
jgi:hypothetical protein